MKQLALRHIALGVVLCGLGGALYLAAQPLLPSVQTKNCQSNLKMIGIAMIQYVRDYDEHYPRAENWADAVKPYAGGSQPNLVSKAENEARYFCPKTGNFYVYNRNLSSLSYTLPIGAITPLAYETGANQKRQNFSDSGQLWPASPIHQNHSIWGNHVVFADRHIELLEKKPAFRSFSPVPKPTATPTPRVQINRSYRFKTTLSRAFHA